MSPRRKPQPNSTAGGTTTLRGGLESERRGMSSGETAGAPAHLSLILAVLAVAGTTFALLQAIVVPALPEIQHLLHTTASGVAWILTANLLSTAVLAPVLGRAGDIL